FTPGGEPVGLTVPGRNHNDPIVAFVGVLPEHRGHGYAYDLLVEATQLLVETGADRIVAATDQTNTPMAATFARAGYPIASERIDLGGRPRERAPRRPRRLEARSARRSRRAPQPKAAHSGRRAAREPAGSARLPARST
ncbi:MAG TPA: GNAT family N-acetyltransferase, partial [Micromonospora sp.]